MVAGLLVVLVGYSGPVLIVREAALAAGLSESQAGSWLFAASFGSGVAGIVLSWRTRQPIVVAFSTAGVVLLTSSLGHYRFSDAVGAYVFVGLACVAIGVSSTFTSLMARIPTPIVSAMLVGVLLRFGIGAFAALGGVGVDGEPKLAITGVVVVMGLIFFVARARGSRLAIVWTALAGAAASFVFGVATDAPVELALVDLEWTTPTIGPAALLGLGLPLLIVALSAQYAPGYGVLKGAGYEPDMNRILAVTGGLGAVLGLLGGSGINLAAITAGLATGPDAHPDPTRRWMAGVWAGLLLIPVSLLGFSALTLFASLPAAFVATVTGLGLFGPIVGAITGALGDERHRDAAIATLLCAASGFSLFDVAAPFWALVIGLGLSALRTPASGRTRAA
ncbi:MAG: benzoate/H(+) symporter BenE family transporter [Acidimicrobiales bacterium]